MSPVNNLRRVNHKYNLRKKRNKTFDILRNPNLNINSPYKRGIDYGLKHKRGKIVQPKSRKSIYIEACDQEDRAMSQDNRPSLAFPTDEEMPSDLARARRNLMNSSFDFPGFPSAGAVGGELPINNISEEAMNRKISESVNKAMDRAQQRITQQMSTMINELMAGLQLNRDVPPRHNNVTNTANQPINSGTNPRRSTGGSQNNKPNPTPENANSQGGFNEEQLGSSLNVSTSTRFSPSTDIQKWDLRFEKMSTKEFMSTVKTQWEMSGYTWQQVYYNFQHFLKNQVERRWYYNFRNSNRHATFDDFSRAFSRRFGTCETDRQITTRMDQRKQGINEPFLVFLEDMELLNASLERSKSEQELIEFLRDNVNCYMRPFIWMKYAANLEEFINLCVNAELQIKKDKFKPSHYQGKVNEVFETEADKTEETVEALYKNQYKNNESVCWNCEEKGHFSRYCPSDTRRIHCFKCGFKGVTTPTCPKCSKGN